MERTLRAAPRAVRQAISRLHHCLGLTGFIMGVAICLCFDCSSQRTIVEMDAEDRFQLARRLLDKDDCLKAAEEFQKIIFNFPGSDYVDDAEFGLGEAHYCLKEYLLAATQFQRILRDYPNSEHGDDAQFMLGMCYFKQSMPSHLDQEYTHKAIDAFQKLIEDFPQSARMEEAQDKLAFCKSKLAKKDYETGRLYLRLEYFDAALLTFREMIAQYSDTPWAAEAQYGIGLVFEQQRRYDEAVEALQKTVSLYPTEKAAERAIKRLQEIKEKRDSH